MSTVASRQYNFVDDKANAIPITASRIDAEFDNAITKLNQKAIISASAPSSPIAGMLWYDSTNKYLKEYRNSEWVIHGIMHIGATEMATPQAGDLWFNSSTGIISKYYGSAWVALANMSFPASAAYGDINYTDISTTALARLGVSGTAGLVLTNSGVSGTPLWGKTNLSGTTQLLGAWVDKSSSYAAQQASTDGFVVVYVTPDTSTTIVTVDGYTDANANPTTQRMGCLVQYTGVGNAHTLRGSFNMPVKKGDYWKVVRSGAAISTWSVYWIPLGSE